MGAEQSYDGKITIFNSSGEEFEASLYESKDEQKILVSKNEMVAVGKVVSLQIPGDEKYGKELNKENECNPNRVNLSEKLDHRYVKIRFPSDGEEKWYPCSYLNLSALKQNVVVFENRRLGGDRYDPSIGVHNQSGENISIELWEETSYQGPKRSVSDQPVTVLPGSVGFLELPEKTMDLNTDYPMNDILNSRFIKVSFLSDGKEKMYYAGYLNAGRGKSDLAVLKDRRLDIFEGPEYGDDCDDPALDPEGEFDPFSNQGDMNRLKEFMGMMGVNESQMDDMISTLEDEMKAEE